MKIFPKIFPKTEFTLQPQGQLKGTDHHIVPLNLEMSTSLKFSCLENFQWLYYLITLMVQWSEIF